MRFQLPDGPQVGGRSYTQVVEAMANQKFSRPRSLQSYRRATALRAKVAYNVTVATDDDRSFVLDLVKNGLLKRLH